MASTATTASLAVASWLFTGFLDGQFLFGVVTDSRGNASLFGHIFASSTGIGRSLLVDGVSFGWLIITALPADTSRYIMAILYYSYVHPPRLKVLDLGFSYSELRAHNSFKARACQALCLTAEERVNTRSRGRSCDTAEALSRSYSQKSEEL